MIDYKSEWYLTKPQYKQFDADSEYWDIKYGDRWTQMVRCLPPNKMLCPRVLEIGCGLGRASDHFKRYGAVVKGIEPADYAIANNRLDQSELIQGDFLTVNVSDSFDIVYIEQVLSHIPDYRAVLQKARDLLVTDGIICIEEPNDYNDLQLRLQREKGEYWVTEDHVNYFTPEIMESVLFDEGYYPCYRTATWPMELFVMEGIDYIGNEETGRIAHNLRTMMLKEMGHAIRTRIKEGFAKMSLGRDLFVIATKERQDAEV